MRRVGLRFAIYLLGATVLIVVAVLVTLHVKREALALKLANQALADSGFRVADLSISRLRPGEVRFRRLLLDQENNGARYDLRDLRVPLSLPDTTVREAAIGRVIVTPAESVAGEPPPAYGEWLELALTLPGRLPELKVAVDWIEWPGWPEIRDTEWVTAGASQAVSARVAGIELDVRATQLDAGLHRLTFQATQGTQTLAATAGLDIARVEAGHRIRGAIVLDFAPLLALARDTFELPAGVEAEGSGSAQIDLAVAADGAGMSGIEATLTPEAGARLRYSVSADLAVEATGLSPVEVSARYPSRIWQLSVPSLSMLAHHPAVEIASVAVQNLDCTPEVCHLTATGDVRAADFGMARVERLNLAGDVTLGFASGWHVTVTPASFSARDLRGSDWRLGELEFAGDVTLGVVADDWEVIAVPASLRAKDVQGGDWRLGNLRLADSAGASLFAAPAILTVSAQRLVLDIGSMATADSLSADARVRLEAFSADLMKPSLASRFELPKDRLDVVWDGVPLVTADLDGRVAFTGTSGRIRLEAADDARALTARIDVAVAPDRIAVTIDDAALDFGTAPLSASFADWPHPWDLARGSGRAAGSIEWRVAERALTGTGRVLLSDAAGVWNDLAATGIRADVPLTLEAGRAAVIGPALIGVGYLDVGLPLENLAATVSWDTASPILGIGDFSVSLLGGTLRAAPFRFDIGSITGNTVLQVDGIQLGLIPALAEFESVELTGSLAGVVPVAVDHGKVTVTGGQLANEPPGGVIRYHAQSAPESGSALGLAQRALSNLEYDSLRSDVSYSEEGDLVMKLRLEGVNPDLDPLQPVILNLNVENNIPQLLESLQATRDIQDVIERRTRKPPAELPP